MQTSLILTTPSQGTVSAFELSKYLERLRLVQRGTLNGQYTDADLTALVKCLAEIRDRLPLFVERLHQQSGASRRLIKDISGGKTRPVLPNFLKVLQGSILVLEDLLNAVSGQGVVADVNFYSGSWPADWKPIKAQQNKQIIGDVVDSIDALVRQLKGGNSPDNDELFLSDVEKATLIAALEVLLGLLKGSSVEMGLVKQSRNWISNLLRKSAEKQIETGLTAAGQKFFKHISEFISGM